MSASVQQQAQQQDQAEAYNPPQRWANDMQTQPGSHSLASGHARPRMDNQNNLALMEQLRAKLGPLYRPNRNLLFQVILKF